MDTAEMGETMARAFREAATGMERFAEAWRASEAADELRRIGYQIPVNDEKVKP